MNNPDWSQGYVTDTTYSDRFFRELSPVWINYVAALNGVAPRDLNQPFTYLELGCGFGTSAMIHAAALPAGEFIACDFNPAHIEAARHRANDFGIENITFLESSFQDLLLRTDRPEFDYIVLHGVYSWVGAESRQAIRKIISRQLKPGGLVYLSYNCLPGWAIEVPLRKLLAELVAAEQGDTEQRAEKSLDVLKQLSESKLRYFTAHASAAVAVDSYRSDPTNYLVHEFLNQTWEPFYSVDVGDEMAGIGTRYAGSATLPDNHSSLVMQESAIEAVAALKTERQRQLAADFAVDRRFRRDIFVRREQTTASKTNRYLGEVIIGCLQNPEQISTHAIVPRGKISFQPDFIRDLQQLMQNGSMTIEQAVSALAGRARNAADISRNLTFLIAAGSLMPFAKTHAPKAARAHRLANKNLERIIAYTAEKNSDFVLPSEIVGNGVAIRAAEALAVAKLLAEGQTLESAGFDATNSVLPNLARLGLVV